MGAIYYVIKCEILIKKNNKSKLKSFISSSLNEINQRILGYVNGKLHDNPYKRMETWVIPIDYLQAFIGSFCPRRLYGN